jgi:Putative MetA-pathway of phenol degradation
MTNKFATLAAAGVLSLCGTTSALAGSVTQPGETIGVAAGAPLPPGFYLVNTADWGCRTTKPADTCLFVDIPVLAWSTPWQIFGARLQFLVATPFLAVEVDATAATPGLNRASIYNPLISGQLAWDLGNGFGFSYLLGAYLGVQDALAWDSTSINQRFALSYTGGGWNLTANVILGIHLDSVSDRAQISPCPDGSGRGCNPDFLNIDLTATKKFGKWEIGPVAFYSTDLNRPIPSYAKQSQFAIGGLVGYDFGPVILQAYLTTDVDENNYGGHDTRGWGRVIVPLGNPLAPPPPAPLVRKN